MAVITAPLDVCVDAAAGAPVDTASLPLAGRAMKRAIDIVVALVGLVLTLPVLLAAMVAVRLDSPGPAVFRQTRVGAGGRRFRLYKLRTMVTDNDDSAHQAYVAAMIRGEAKANGGVYKMTDDPRITRLGHVLRRYSIDELPQLWNVLRGDMSLIGPRPPLPREVDLYDDWALQRLAVKPGLSGLWQVSGRCELDFNDMVALDIEYWRHWSLARDLKIMAKTPVAMFSKRGAA